MFHLNRKKTWKWLKILAIVYCLAGAGLYFFQEKLLFHPEPLPADYVFRFDHPFRELTMPMDDSRTVSLIQFTVPDSQCRGVVLYFHGNRKNVTRYAPFARNFTKHGYEVWMVDYPGFGKSNGERSEQVLYDDALQVYKMAQSRFSRDSIIIYGKSIGTGIAAQLASRRDCKRLILETPYYSIAALFRHYAWMYPVDWMTKYKFPTCQYFSAITAPVTLFHGTRDEVVPYQHSTWLLKAARSPAELITLEGGYHNNLNDFPLFHQKLDSLLQLP